MAIYRNPDGFSVHNTGERFASYERLTPFKYHTYFEDFIAITSGVPEGWTHTNTNGTLALTTPSSLTQTLGGADNDLSQLQATSNTLVMVSGKKAFFRWRGKVDKGSTGTIGEQELYVGIGTVQTGTNFVAAAGTSLAVDDFVGFASYDGTANICATVRVTDVESVEANITSYADVTTLELGWDFDGTTVTFWKDANRLTQISAFPTGAMAPVIYFKGGEAKAAVLTTDYIFVAIER